MSSGVEGVHLGGWCVDWVGLSDEDQIGGPLLTVCWVSISLDVGGSLNSVQ